MLHHVRRKLHHGILFDRRLIQILTSKNSNSITKTRRRHETWKKKKNRTTTTTKKISPTSNRALECHDKTNSNQLRSARYPLELTKQQWEIMVLQWLYPLTKQKVSFVFRLTIVLQKMPLGKLKVVCIHNISKMKSKPAKQNTGWCFSIEMKGTCKNSANLEQETKTTKVVTYPLLSLASSIIFPKAITHIKVGS